MVSLRRRLRIRLLQRDSWDLCIVRPRVEEVLGCLIPPELHPKWDGKAPRGKAGAGVQTTGVVVTAGGWRVDVAEQQDLLEVRLSKGMLEFL